MSRLVTHGRTTEQRVALHEKRLLALERNSSLDSASYGVPQLRDALFTAAGVTRGESARNFDSAYANSNFTWPSDQRRYMAVYWPGGINTGMTFLMAVPGVYTDTTPNSGTAVYSTDGTTLTRQAATNAKWTQAAGETRVPWSGGTVQLNPGIYYVACEYFETAQTTAPQFAATSTAADALGGDGEDDLTPTNWPLVFSSAGVTGQCPSTAAISGLVQGTATTLPYVGLY